MKEAKLKAGVIGWPVKYSLSPRLHNYWLKQYGIDGSYEALAVAPEELTKFLKNLPELGYCGVNLTVPHKQAAHTMFLSEYGTPSIDRDATRTGAINTVVVRKDKKLEGRNTDAYGFKQNLLAAGFDSKNRPAVVLGAGGAARAAIVALFDMGVKDIRLVNRTASRAERLMREWGDTIGIYDWKNCSKAFSNVGLFANATSLGMQGQPPFEISLENLPLEAVVTDLVYTPLMTGLLRAAQKRGHKIIDGLGMLLYQAQPGFEAWFGVKPEITPALRAYMIEAL